MLKIGRSRGRLIFHMGIPVPRKTGFYIETGPVATIKVWYKVLYASNVFQIIINQRNVSRVKSTQQI